VLSRSFWRTTAAPPMRKVAVDLNVIDWPWTHFIVLAVVRTLAIRSPS
jgi:hypothetical protein